MTSSHHGPYGQGYTCYNGRAKGLPPAEVELIHKPIVVRIAVCNGLREVGIASNRESECHGEYVPGPHTARHTMGVGCSRSS